MASMDVGHVELECALDGGINGDKEGADSQDSKLEDDDALST